MHNAIDTRASAATVAYACALGKAFLATRGKTPTRRGARPTPSPCTHLTAESLKSSGQLARNLAGTTATAKMRMLKSPWARWWATTLPVRNWGGAVSRCSKGARCMAKAWRPHRGARSLRGGFPAQRRYQTQPFGSDLDGRVGYTARMRLQANASWRWLLHLATIAVIAYCTEINTLGVPGFLCSAWSIKTKRHSPAPPSKAS